MNRKTENPKNQRIQVFARCRPLNSIEKKQCSPSVVEVIPDKKIVVKDRNANREFLFDRVFSPNTKQVSVYKAVVEPLIQEVLMGYNCTVFAYGQTGTGKTYTMEGERNNTKCSWEDDPGAGIIPRSLHQLFEDLNKEENVEFSVRVSFLELYNEELFDLLNSNELTKLRLFEDSSKKGSVIIQGLEEVLVNSKDEVYSILEKGTARRQTAATMLNATSSRSHTVFSVTVHIKENTIEGEELLKTGKLNLVDLAGSENVGRSGAVDKRAREAGNINQSLLTLGRVITALIEKQPHVPYRESKLTRLLQDSLGGHTKTSIIATISPALCNFDETISTLDYATKAKSITIKPEANQKMTKRALIKEYTEEIERLRRDLVALRSKEGFYVDSDNYNAILNEIEEKEKMVKNLSEMIETLKEENLKIEEMFNETKRELALTSEKLNETSQRYEQTVVKLSDTTKALTFTQAVLSETALERDEKQLLLNVQCKTERTLSQQAQKLLNVANETTSDVDKLHAKIDRKTTVEKTNEEKCKEFRMLYQKQFALLDDLVSHSEKQQCANLSRTQKNLDELVESLQNHHSQMSNYLNQFTSMIASGVENLSQSYTSGASSQMNWTNTLLEDMNHKKEVLYNKQSVFLCEKIPELLNEISMKNSETEKWISSTHQKICQQIEEQKQALSERSARRSEIQSSIKDSLDALCNSYDEILTEYKMQTSNVATAEDKFDKDLEDQLTELRKVLTSFEKIAEYKKELRKCSSKRDHYLVMNLESSAFNLKAVKQPLSELSNLELTLEDEKGALDEISTLLNIDEISAKQDSLKDSQKRIANEFEEFTKSHMKEEEGIFSETEKALKCNLSSISQNVEYINNNMSEMKSSFELHAQSGKTLLQEDVSKIQTVIVKSKDDIKQSEEALGSFTMELKDEILKRDLEFEKFISEDLVKDIPTGTTPQRKNYTYPRMLAATSPHERILERYRRELAKNTAVAVNLPLDSSFNEIDEDSLASSQERINSTETHSISFSSDESASCETDSYASSVSDASVEGGRNKENKRKTKKSRLPKRLANKGFVKPAPPSAIRKPLTVTNCAQEQTDI